MLNSPLSRTGRPQESWAELRAHNRVTRYRRRGVGQPVLLLRAGENTPLWIALGDALSDRYRLLIPELDETDRQDSRWILEFLEGLGCSNVIVLCDAQFARATLDLIALGCDQIARVVIVEASPSARSSNGDIPLLTVDATRDAPDVLALVAEFLARPS